MGCEPPYLPSVAGLSAGRLSSSHHLPFPATPFPVRLAYVLCRKDSLLVGEAVSLPRLVVGGKCPLPRNVQTSALGTRFFLEVKRSLKQVF